MICTSSKRFRWHWFAVLLITVAVSSLPNPSTWASPPHVSPPPQTPPVDIEPFAFQLKKSPSGTMASVATAPVRPTAGGDWSDLMYTDFEGTWLPSHWEVQGADVWVQSTHAYSGTHSAAVEDFDGTPITWLVYGGESGFSLADWADAKLNFAYWLDTDANTFFGWAASADGVGFTGARTSGRVGSWLSGSFDLKHLVGDDSVWIAFALSGDGGGAAQNVRLDDVLVRAQEPYRLYLPAAFKDYVSPFPDFNDDFSDTSSGWPRQHINNLPQYEAHRDYSSEYGSTYKMKLGGWTWFHRLFASPQDVYSRDDFTLQTNIMYDLGDHRAEWGLIFEANDDMSSYYMVALYIYHPYVYYRIRWRKPSGSEVELVPSLPAPGFLVRSKGEWNTIRVVREGNSIYFYARNPGTGQWTLLDSTDNAPPLSDDRVGFTVFNTELGADAWFDNFHLWQRPLHP